MKRPKDRWTKRELTLRQGVQQLARAVIEQWIEDGKPECDKQVIEYWKAIADFEVKNDCT